MKLREQLIIHGVQEGQASELVAAVSAWLYDQKVRHDRHGERGHTIADLITELDIEQRA